MRTILLTGSNGLLGQKIIYNAVSKPEINLIATARGANRTTLKAGYTYAPLDITNEDDINKLFETYKPHILINTAAATNVDACEVNKEEATLLNVTAVQYLAEACKKYQTHFIHLSTDFVFDGTASVPYLETDKTNPLSVYGASKLAGEELVLKNNPDSIIIRTSWVYSSFGNNFVKTILKLCKEREQLNIIFDQIGTPTYARDLAAVVLQIVQQDEWKPGIYNYSNEGVASWYDFAVAIRDLAGLKTKMLPIETSQYPTPAMRPKYNVLNKKKMKETFGIEIPY